MQKVYDSSPDSIKEMFDKAEEMVQDDQSIQGVMQGAKSGFQKLRMFKRDYRQKLKFW